MNPTAQTSPPLNVEDLLVEIAEVVNATLDLDTLLKRTAEQVRRVIDYEIFSILLLNEKTQELRIRFAIGHPPEVAERIRIKMGEGVTGLAAQQREALLVNDVTKSSLYIKDMADVRSELAVPLIIKNRVIGVIDIEALRDHRARAQWDNWMKDLRTELYQMLYEQPIYPKNLYLDREPMKHEEYREKVIQKQIDLMHERGIWVKPER